MLNKIKERFKQSKTQSGDTEWLIKQVEEFERYKKYVIYFAGKDKVNDIRIAMEENELD